MHDFRAYIFAKANTPLSAIAELLVGFLDKKISAPVTWKLLVQFWCSFAREGVMVGSTSWIKVGVFELALTLTFDRDLWPWELNLKVSSFVMFRTQLNFVFVFTPLTVRRLSNVKLISIASLCPNSITSILLKTCLKPGLRHVLSRKKVGDLVSDKSETWSPTR